MSSLHDSEAMMHAGSLKQLSSTFIHNIHSCICAQWPSLRQRRSMEVMDVKLTVCVCGQGLSGEPGPKGQVRLCCVGIGLLLFPSFFFFFLNNCCHSYQFTSASFLSPVKIPPSATPPLFAARH